ncbi:MAG: hypothetical protein JW963_16785 [Anaerolineales bacterium]|nr:hypothetical protein [Anaerolineales bacterium]
MDNPLRTFSLMLEAMAELQPEIEAAQQALRLGSPVPAAPAQAGKTKPIPVAPSLADSLSELGPLPREALLLGLASDGLPVLLNLHDPHPGPLLIAADPGTGKTALLQMIAQAAAEMHTPGDVQFGAVTNYPDEWGHLAELEHCVGIFPTYHDSAMDFLHSLSGWAHANKGSQQSILLLVDDLESMEHIDFDARQTLRWLLLRGPARRVWPILSMNAERALQVESWLEAFRTHIFGNIQDDRTAENLSDIQGASLSQLQAGLQFALREGNDWLKFWIPEI